jgi:hypothetical protein
MLRTRSNKHKCVTVSLTNEANSVREAAERLVGVPKKDIDALGDVDIDNVPFDKVADPRRAAAAAADVR